MRFMKPTMIIFAILTLAFTVIACGQVFFGLKIIDDASAPLNTVVSILVCVLLFIFAAVTLWGVFGDKLRLKMIGVYALHVGLLIFLLGGFVYSLLGKYILTGVPVNASSFYSSVQTKDGEEVELGFEFSLTHFKVERYDPVYNVYKQEGENGKLIMENVSIDAAGYYDFKQYGKKHVSSISGGGVLYQQINLEKNIVAILSMPVKYYEGDVSIRYADGSMENTVIAVNYPLRVSGWKIYLMSYSEAENSATFLFKYDPMEAVSIIGILVTILGTFYVCIAKGFVDKTQLRKRIKVAEVKKNDSN